ncbi:MAG: RluA family pseudouridine synthase [Deltaproteobacteria bacterium]|nr:RluA family pseudouridine synthase [Deltaproteobacteria bacterium]
MARLERFLHESYPSVSIRGWCRALLAGEIFVGGRRAAKGRPLSPGETISFSAELLTRLAPEKPRPEVSPLLEIVYQDDNLLAVNKPAACHTHPLTGTETGTLANRLIAAFPELAGVGGFGPLQPGLLNRLDYGTSGVVLVGRNNDSWHAVRQQFVRHQVCKEYVAVVAGCFPGTTVVEKALTHDGRDSRRMVITPPAKPCRGIYAARTEIFPLLYDAARDVSRVRLVMFSGVMHQLRVHLAAVGHPLAGDLLYGSESCAAEREKGSEAISANRFQLHCAKLILADGRVVEAPLPPWFVDPDAIMTGVCP